MGQLSQKAFHKHIRQVLLVNIMFSPKSNFIARDRFATLSRKPPSILVRAWNSFLEATPEVNPRSAYNKSMHISDEDFDELNIVGSSDV